MASSSSPSSPPPSSLLPSPSSSCSLTFGIELEFWFIALKRHHSRDSGTSSTPDIFDAVEAVHKALSSKLRASCSLCEEPVFFNLPLKDWTQAVDDYSLWNVGIEAMIAGFGESEAMEFMGIEAAEKYAWHGVEVKSRILRFDKGLEVRDPTSEHVHKISWEQEIHAVVERLRSRFCSFGSEGHNTSYLYTGKTCGLHVHVGNEDKGFGLDWLKKITCLYLGCERQIDSIHPINRISAVEWATRPIVERVPYFNARRTVDNGVHNRPLSAALISNNYLRRQNERRDDKDPQQLRIMTGPRYPNQFLDRQNVREASQGNDRNSWFSLIANAPDMQALHDLYLKGSKNVTVNFRNLDPAQQHPDPIKKTVEYRQHTTTVETVRIVSWVDLVCRVVQYARENDLNSIIDLFSPQGHLGSPETNLVNVCELFGCSAATMHHYRNQLSGEYAKNVRAREKKAALDAHRRDDPLAELALYAIRKERRELNPENTRGRQLEKLQIGGYGQFAPGYIDAIAPPSMTATERERITLGYKAPWGPPNSKFADFSV